MCERTSVGRLGQDSCQRRRSWGPNLVGARLTWRQQGLAGPFPPSTLPCPETSVSAEQRLLPSLPRLPSLGPYFLPVVPEALCHCPGTFLPGPSQGPRPCYPSPSSPLHLLAPVVPGPRAPPQPREHLLGHQALPTFRCVYITSAGCPSPGPTLGAVPACVAAL